MTTYVFVHIYAYICVHIFYICIQEFSCVFLISQALLVVTTIASESLRDGTKGREPLKLVILQLINIDFKENYKKKYKFWLKRLFTWQDRFSILAVMLLFFCQSVAHGP